MHFKQLLQLILLYKNLAFIESKDLFKDLKFKDLFAQ